MPTVKKERAFELDFLRGFALFIMFLHHTAYDLRYVCGLDILGFQNDTWFWVFFQPFFMMIFIVVSGICCSFSGNNLKRGLKLLVFALLFSATTYVITFGFGLYCYVIFNVFHVVAVSCLVYAGLVFLQKKLGIKKSLMNVIIGVMGIYSMIIGYELPQYDRMFTNRLLIPLGFVVKKMPEMADYLPLFPWMGIFLLGSLIGRVCYSDKKTLFPSVGKRVRAFTGPFEFLGRHSIICYVLHQPVILGILYLIFLCMGVDILC